MKIQNQTKIRERSECRRGESDREASASRPRRNGERPQRHQAQPNSSQQPSHHHHLLRRGSNSKPAAAGAGAAVKHQNPVARASDSTSRQPASAAPSGQLQQCVQPNGSSSSRPDRSHPHRHRPRPRAHGGSKVIF